MHESPLMDYPEVATVFKTTPGNVRQWKHRGILPDRLFVRMGKRVFVHRGKFNEFLDDGGQAKKHFRLFR